MCPSAPPSGVCGVRTQCTMTAWTACRTQTSVTWASSTASSSLRTTSTVSTSSAAGTPTSTARCWGRDWVVWGHSEPWTHAVGFIWCPRSCFKQCRCCVCFRSWRLPLAVAGLQCWSWRTHVVVTTWGRLCWENFAPF